MLKSIVTISTLTASLLFVGCGSSSSDNNNGTSSSSSSTVSSSVSSLSSSSSSAISSVASSSSVSSSSSSSSAISDVNLTNACAYDSVYIAIYMNMNDTMLQFEKDFWGDNYTKIEGTALCTDYGFPATPDSEDNSSGIVVKNYLLPATGYGNSILCNESDLALTTSAGNNNLIVYKVTGDGTNQCTSASSSSSVSSASSSSASSEPSIVDTSKLFLPDQTLCEAGKGTYVAGACYAVWSDANTMCQLLSKAQLEKIITDCGGSTDPDDQINNVTSSSYQDCYKSYGLFPNSPYWSTTAGETAGTRYRTMFYSGMITEFDETEIGNVLCLDE